MGDRAGESGTKSPSVKALLCGVPSPASSSPSSLSPESRSNRDSGTSEVKPNYGTKISNRHHPSPVLGWGWGGVTECTQEPHENDPRMLCTSVCPTVLDRGHWGLGACQLSHVHCEPLAGDRAQRRHTQSSRQALRARPCWCLQNGDGPVVGPELRGRAPAGASQPPAVSKPR